MLYELNFGLFVNVSTIKKIAVISEKPLKGNVICCVFVPDDGNNSIVTSSYPQKIKSK
jgi:hypothetical protein